MKNESGNSGFRVTSSSRMWTSLTGPLHAYRIGANTLTILGVWRGTYEPFYLVSTAPPSAPPYRRDLPGGERTWACLTQPLSLLGMNLPVTQPDAHEWLGTSGNHPRFPAQLNPGFLQFVSSGRNEVLQVMVLLVVIFMLRGKGGVVLSPGIWLFWPRAPRDRAFCVVSVWILVVDCASSDLIRTPWTPSRLYS